MYLNMIPYVLMISWMLKEDGLDVHGPRDVDLRMLDFLCHRCEHTGGTQAVGALDETEDEAPSSWPASTGRDKLASSEQCPGVES